MSAAVAPGTPPYHLALLLAFVQFLFVTCWTVYAAYLPQLAAAAGIGREKVIWILMLDQLVFALMDLVMGQASDRVREWLGRIGLPIAVLSLTSCVAFALLPHAAFATGMALPLSVALLLVWLVTSSALRAPPWVLLSRYAAQPRMPTLAALQLTGLAIGAGVAPFLAMTLRQTDPRLPFLLAGVALALTTTSLVFAERSLAASPEPRGVPVPRPAPRPMDRTVVCFVIGCGMLALATQIHLFVNSGPQFLRFVPKDELERYLPIFWIGFIAMFPGASLAERYGLERVLGIAAFAGVCGTLLAALAPSVTLLAIAQALAGGAWGCILMAGFSASMRLGHRGREGTMLGLFWAALSAATLLRMAFLAAEAPEVPLFAPAAGWAPVGIWIVGTGLLLMSLGGRSGKKLAP